MQAEWIEVVVTIGVAITIIKVSLIATDGEDEATEGNAEQSGAEPEHQSDGDTGAIGERTTFDDWWARTRDPSPGREQGPLCGSGWV